MKQHKFKYKKKGPYIIAEIGSNHNGSISIAKKTIIAAKKAGADCVKFQSFTPESLFSHQFLDNNINLKKEVFKYFLSSKKLNILSDFCKKKSIDFASTPFSESELNFSHKKLKVKFIKIASMDLNNYPFLRKVAKIKKPVVLSTGMGSYIEINKALNIFKKYKTHVTLLHCVSMYPAKHSELNLKKILLLKDKFKCEVGYSDHSIGPDACILSSILGSKVIEKHFTLNKKMEGWDHHLSADFLELKYIIQKCQEMMKMLGTKSFDVKESKKQIRAFRRSIVAKYDLPKGKKIKESDLDYKRPGNALSPENNSKIIGRILKKNIKFDQQIKLNNF